MGKVDHAEKIENIPFNQSQIQKVLNDNKITNLAEFQQFLYLSNPTLNGHSNRHAPCHGVVVGVSPLQLVDLGFISQVQSYQKT